MTASPPDNPETPAPAKAAKPRRPWTWKRRLKVAGISLVVGVLAFRILLMILLPAAIARTARALGYTVSYERLQLSLVGTNAALWGVDIKTRDGKEQILKTDYAYANLSSSRLLRLKIKAWRLEADDVSVDLVRKPDGTIPLLQAIQGAATSKAQTPGAPRPVTFASPLELNAVRLHNVTLHVRDESVSPPFDHSIRTDVRLNRVGKLGTPATLEIESTTDALFDAMRVSVDGTNSMSTLDAKVEYSLRGLRAGVVTPYLRSLGLSVADRTTNITGAATVSLAAVPGAPGQVSGSVSLAEISVTSESETAASLAKADVQIAALSPSSLHVSKVLIDRGTVRAERAEDGRLRFAAVVLGKDGPEKVAASPPPAPPPASQATGSPTGTPFSVQIDEVGVSGVKLSLVDRAVSPVNTLVLNIDQVRASNIATQGPPESAATFSAAISAPGLFTSLAAEARATPFAPSPGGGFSVSLTGIHPNVLNPYLEPLGIHSTLESGELKLEGSVSAVAKAGESPRLSLSIANASLKDGGTELLGMRTIALNDLGVGADSSIEVGSIEAKGPVLSVKRLPNGDLAIPGFKIGAAPAAPAAAKPASAPAPLRTAAPQAAAPAAGLPPIKIGKFSWTGTKIRFEDEAAVGSAPLEIADAGVEIQSLVVDPRPGTKVAPGTIKAWLASPGLADNITFTGTVSPGEGGLGAKLSGRGTALDLSRLAPYLKPLGFEPTLQQGSFTLDFSTRVQVNNEALKASLSIDQAALLRGDDVLGSVSGVSVSSVEVGAGGIAVGKIVVDGARASAGRGGDGLIEALGVKLLPSPTKPKTDAPIPDPFTLLASAGAVSLEGASIRNVQIAWSDEMTRTPVNTKIELGAAVGGIALNKKDLPPAPFELDLSATGIAGKVQVKGELTVAPDAIGLTASASGEGIDSAVVSAYLPPGTEARFKDGRLAASLKLTLGKAEPDGLAARLDVSGVDWTQGSQSLLRVGQFTVDVARFDLANFDTHVRAIEGSGISAAVNRNADGTIDALGVAIGGAAPAPTEPKPAAPAADLKTIVAGTKSVQPLISLDKLDVRIDRFSVTDRARPDAAPVAVVNARTYSKGPIRLLGPKPEENPPVSLAFETGIEPITSRVGVELQTTPFAQQPSLAVRLDVSGIDGEGIVKALPEVKDFIGAADLQGARFTTSVDAEATVRRRGPTQIDLSRGLDLSFTVNETKLTRADGTVLGGVAMVRGEGVKVDTNGGGIAAKSIDISGLSGNAWRDEQGVHAMGALVKLPADKTVAKTPKPAEPEAASPPALPAKPPSTATPTPGGTQAATPEFRIDRLTLSGLDFRFEDRVLQPPVTIPINALDADIRGLSSRAMTQDLPVKFNVSAGAGKVKLPKVVRGGALIGARSDHANQGKTDSQATPDLEDRDFFSQCTASGNLALYPMPHGRANASISGVELSALRGLAAAEGAAIGGGVFDARADVRSIENGNLEIRARIVLTDLKYHEPPDGPVARNLHLSMPLDTAIAAVEAPDGSITLPVNVTMTNKGISSGEITSAATGAIADVLATAVASAPVKVVTGFAGLFGDTKGDSKWVEEPPIILTYTPGVSLLDDGSQSQLNTVLERAADSKKVQVAISHELGTADAALCAARTNPPAEIARELAESLRQRRAELLQRRLVLLPAAQAESIRADPEAEALSQLRDIQVQLAGVDDAMDRLYDLLKPGAERTAGRRTRAAYLELADWRLNAVRRAVNTVGGPAGASRTAVAVPKADATDSEQSRLVIQVRHRGR